MYIIEKRGYMKFSKHDRRKPSYLFSSHHLPPPSYNLFPKYDMSRWMWICVCVYVHDNVNGNMGPNSKC